MKNLVIKLLILILLFITFSLTVFALEVRKINIQEDIYNKIPSKDYVFLDFKVLPNKNIVVFYQDKEEKNLNKIFISFIDTQSKKILKTIKTDLIRYKESIVDNQGNLYILSWKPVNVYFLDTTKYQIQKVYDNSLPTENKEKFIFTLDSSFIKADNGNILTTVDLKKEEAVSEDVVICKIENEKNLINLIPYFSYYKISSFFSSKPFIMMLNYPNKIFIKTIKENKLYLIQTNTGYSKEIEISKIIKEYPFECTNLFDINGNKTLLSIRENGKNKLVVLNVENDQKTYIEPEKFISAKFLNDNQIIFNTIEKQKINFFLFNIEKNNYEKLELGEVKGVNIGILENNSFFTFDKNNIYIISLQNEKQ